MLVRLISARQVVLLYDNSKVYLFYCGKVYTRPKGTGFSGIPLLHKRLKFYPIWTLIDVDFEGQGPPITRSSNIWPIQASPPNHLLWSWRSERWAGVLGMPRWNTEELIEGYVFPLSAVDSGHVV